MNVALWKRHQNTALTDARDMFYKSHEEVLRLAERYSNEELFSKGVYKWLEEAPWVLTLSVPHPVIMTGR